MIFQLTSVVVPKSNRRALYGADPRHYKKAGHEGRRVFSARSAGMLGACSLLYCRDEEREGALLLVIMLYAMRCANIMSRGGGRMHGAVCFGILCDGLIPC